MRTVESNKERIKAFRSAAGMEIIGQDHILDQLDSHFLRSEQGLTETGLPRGGFMFVGPTGVGKTEVTKFIARHFFGDEGMGRFDMSEFMQRDTVGAFVERVCEAVRSGTWVLLFDEVEKAHLDILNLFLQILSAARLTDGSGQTVDFSNCYVIMTSNIGAEEAMRIRARNRVSFEKTIKYHVGQKIRRPELIGRFEEVGGILVFYPLDEQVQRRVAEVAVRKMLKRMAALGHHVTLDASAMEYVMRHGFNAQYGARPLQGLLRREVEGAIGRVSIDDRKAVGTISVSADRSRLELRPV